MAPHMVCRLLLGALLLHTCTGHLPTQALRIRNQPNIRQRLRFRQGNERCFRVKSSGDSASGAGDVVSKYFGYWNERKMGSAIDLFDERIQYEDTLYPGKFEGKDSLKSHLLNVAAALPDNFNFVLDDLAVSPPNSEGVTNVGVQWHVGLDDGTPLPFTRGCSMYKVNSEGLIIFGFDVPEPVAKTGNISLGILKAVSGILKYLQKNKQQ
mmetsp:Transcript_14432/g.25952  ORF Transcript_14432/g.25952 Transcript_14432/m.25952 type:complete len:210 (+) Transcript_14432:14-643(+)